MRSAAPICLPLLFAVAPVLSLYASNAGELRAAEVAPALLWALLAASLLNLLAAVVYRDLRKGALLASLGVLLFFLYGHAFTWYLDWRGASLHFVAHRAVGTTFALLWLSVGVVLQRTRRALDETFRAAAITGALLCAMTGARLPWSSIVEEWRVRSDTRAALGPTEVRAGRAERRGSLMSGGPDVYYVILDGYARTDVLLEVFRFDNSPFIAALEARGFFIARESLANYSTTHHSLASSLSMSYLDPEGELVSSDQGSPRPSCERIQDPAVGRLFQKNGYRFIHFATNYSGTQTSKIADEIVPLLRPWLTGEFGRVLIRNTALRPLEPNLAESYLHMFSELERVRTVPGPKFVFAHFTLPHNPYVFYRDGTIRRDIPLDLQWNEKTGSWFARAAYVQQLEFVNGRVLAWLDLLLNDRAGGARARPVVLLQSDHGSAARILASKLDGSPRRFYLERFPILNALLAPEPLKQAFRPDISPVNSFRVLANGLFDSGFTLLPDRHYFRWYEDKGRIVDVTGIVRAGQASITAPPQAK